MAGALVLPPLPIDLCLSAIAELPANSVECGIALHTFSVGDRARSMVSEAGDARAAATKAAMARCDLPSLGTVRYLRCFCFENQRPPEGGQ